MVRIEILRAEDDRQDVEVDLDSALAPLDPVGVADALGEDGVYVYSVPLGNDSDGDGVQNYGDTDDDGDDVPDVADQCPEEIETFGSSGLPDPPDRPVW